MLDLALRVALSNNDLAKAQQIIDYEEWSQTSHHCLLHDVISSGHISIINVLLDKGNCDVNERNSKGDTPLHLAVRQLCESNLMIWAEVVVELMQKGAHIGYQNNEGNTPVHVAFLNDPVSTVVLDALLQFYVKILELYVPSSSVNKEGLGIFHIACTRGDLKVLKTLALHGIYEKTDRVSVKSPYYYAGYSSLHFAVTSGQREVVKALLASEVNVYAADRNDSTPLHLALQIRDNEMIELLLPHYQFDSVDELGYSHFMAACTSSEAKFVEGYLQAATINFPIGPVMSVNGHVQCTPTLPSAGYTPLHFAVEGGNHKIVELLLEQNADFNAKDINGSTPLHLALYRRDKALIDRILSEDRTLENVVDAFGVSHFMAACAINKPSIVKEFLSIAETRMESTLQTLINARVKNDAKVYAEYSPLHFAVEFGNHEVVKLLLDRNANVYAKNADQSTPLHLALQCCDTKMIDLILAYDQMTENFVDNYGLSHFMAACTGSNASVVKKYLQVAELQFWTSPSTLINGITNHPRWAGYSPIHFAAEFGRVDTVELLLTFNANCCILTSRKLTPLMLAQKHIDVCELLQQHCPGAQWYKDAILTRLRADLSSGDSVYSGECDIDKEMLDFNFNQMDCENYEQT